MQSIALKAVEMRGRTVLITAWSILGEQPGFNV